MSSSEHPAPQAQAEPFDPARMNAQTARLMASDMAALAGAMFRLLQPQSVAQPETVPASVPVTQAPPAPEPALPVPGIAVPGLDLQPPTPAAPPSEPAPDFAVPPIAVPSLAVPGIQPPSEEVSERAEEPALPDADESDVPSPRSQALMDEIAFLDD